MKSRRNGRGLHGIYPQSGAEVAKRALAAPNMGVEHGLLPGGRDYVNSDNRMRNRNLFM